MFELAFAAEMKLRGGNVTLGDPDIVLDEEKRFLFECKRPARESSIRANIRGAADQLNTKLEREGNMAASGVITISLSRVLNPGTRIFVTSSKEGKERLGDRLAELMREHEQDWARKEGLSSRVCGVLFNAVTPAAIGDAKEQKDSLVKLSYATLMDTGRDRDGFKMLTERLQVLLPTD